MKMSRVVRAVLILIINYREPALRRRRNARGHCVAVRVSNRRRDLLGDVVPGGAKVGHTVGEHRPIQDVFQRAFLFQE